MKNTITWTFPLLRTHTGIPLGNATTGLIIWGEKARLKITIGRADFWDHRGGMTSTEKHNYLTIRNYLENSDELKLRKLFTPDTQNEKGSPLRPSIIPVGRLDFILPDNSVLQQGILDIQTGIATIEYTRLNRIYKIKIHLSMETQVSVIEFPEPDFTIEKLPAWTYLSDYLASISFDAPISFDNDLLEGWFQSCPKDQGLGIGYKQINNMVWVLAQRSYQFEEVKDLLRRGFEQSIDKGLACLISENTNWWSNYWQTVPVIQIPNERLDFIYSYGLYKFAGFTNPSGCAATLQGPWIEEYQMPPWSSDYHFNINVQMCYWPAYKANKLKHLLKLFDMIWTWRDKLRANAKFYVGIDDGYMLPTAVDNHGRFMGNFWPGFIDHASTAWVAQMMFDYVQYSNDTDFLLERAFPFMKGAMRIYEEILEKDGDALTLPITVSPEYRGSAINAWGKNASFQLACIHRLAENLLTAANLLAIAPKPIWLEIKKNLPEATISHKDKATEVIGLWEGLNLEKSHRHFSHLAAIHPFDTIDIYSEKWKKIVSDTIDHWLFEGMGRWCGWSFPWASMIQTRLGNGEIAELLLEIWERFFTNESNASLIDCHFPGFSLIGAPSFYTGLKPRPEFMQMEASMGAVAAIQEMLLHSRRGIIYIFPAVPKCWKNIFFKEMLCEGGFLVSAEKSDDNVSNIIIKSQHNKILKLFNPWNDEKINIKSNQNPQLVTKGKILNITMKKNEILTLQKYQ